MHYQTLPMSPRLPCGKLGPSQPAAYALLLHMKHSTHLKWMLPALSNELLVTPPTPLTAPLGIYGAPH
jgi:hypothetical protein